ncbi:hypothetical protein Hoch_6673 [Haliangium ochraceum DSM 14365]|uniref:Secreted protein n=1 Tax=Haliangium ochraceum (strain DSM 14365 / JCM 11303 / SMP-2) TaxID=502025 RepID=D0LT03_HALO1|nr:hypothetical protein Hoch_6673 [Haliangium ochraceum DSM 14365]
MRYVPLLLLLLVLPLLAAPDCVSYGSSFSGNPINKYDCTANLSECLDSDLWHEPGNQPGHSVCHDC